MMSLSIYSHKKKQCEDMTKSNILDYETFKEAWKKLPEKTS